MSNVRSEIFLKTRRKTSTSRTDLNNDDDDDDMQVLSQG